MKPQESSTPSSGSSLLQLVSEHSITNLLPVMALRPSRVVLVRSADGGKGQRLEHAASQLRAALQVLSQDPAFKGYQPKLADLVLNGHAPDIAETRDAIAKELVGNPAMIVNFTGGSKQMSIGAHLAASAFGRASFFCDPAEPRLMDAHTGRHERWAEIGPLTKHFTVRLLFAVQGRNLDDYRSETANDAMRAFGLKSFELRNQHWNALDAFNKALRSHFYTQNGRLPQDVEELKVLLAKPLAAQATSGEAVRSLLTSAASAGLARSEPQGWRLLAQPERKSVERIVLLITQAWTELAVLDCLQRNPRYQGSLWNLEPAKQQSNEHTDSDIVCVDTKTASLRTICCKATLNRSPAEHLESMAERARKLGGASCTFVVFKPAQGQEALIRSEARRLGIDVALEADEIVKAFAPHAK